MSSRYEILPFGSSLDEVRAVPGPRTITVTCSPRHGLDHSVDWALAVAEAGHRAVVHLAARAVRDAEHLDAVLARLRSGALDDVFVVGGDAPEAAGPYASAVDLLPVVAAHPLRPARLGIGAYPEGHPLIDPDALSGALATKAALADYLVTQMCFDPDVLVEWIAETRAAGIALPVYVGLPGAVDPRRLLEVSMRIGVGTSISYLRKQHGIRHLLSRRHHASDRLLRRFAPLVGQAGLGIAGLHFFTFNRLEATLAWEADLVPDPASYAMPKTGAARR